MMIAAIALGCAFPSGEALGPRQGSLDHLVEVVAAAL
jgi:hypothetical protein